MAGKKSLKNALVAFQGAYGAYSDLAAREVFPSLKTLPCPSFNDVFDAVKKGEAQYGMIPIDNSTAGRVADVHHLLPESGVHIVGEHFLRIQHYLLAPQDATFKTVKEVRSHSHALGQCGKMIRKLGLKATVHTDTAGAASEVAELNDPSIGAIASKLAGSLYGLKTLNGRMEDNLDNTTRFVIIARAPHIPEESVPCITSLVFRVKNIPAALYKTLGGFAKNGVNISKIESYVKGSRLSIAQFYMEIEGHPKNPNVKEAIKELKSFTKELKILGTYEASPFRHEL